MTTANSLVGRPRSVSRIAQLPRQLPADALVAIVAFVGLCIAVLIRAPQVLEPDDYAYRASIVALSHGHILLSNAQYLGLEHQLGSSTSGAGPGGGAIQQWDHLANGLWISEKNPGYPLLAVPFQWLGSLRLTPLFDGTLASAGLWFGARRWIGRWEGAVVVAGGWSYQSLVATGTGPGGSLARGAPPQRAGPQDGLGAPPQGHRVAGRSRWVAAAHR
jgi:hypothetical protein